MNDAVERVLAPRGGTAAIVAAVVRVVAGAVLVLVGVGKFADHMQEAVDFRNYGVPLPDLAVWVSGTIEVAGGVLLVLGLATRLAAALIAVNLGVALATAGVMEGGAFHLGLGPALLLAMVFLLWAGAGAWSLDGRLAARAASSRRRGAGLTPLA